MGGGSSLGCANIQESGLQLLSDFGAASGFLLGSLSCSTTKPNTPSVSGWIMLASDLAQGPQHILIRMALVNGPFKKGSHEGSRKVLLNSETASASVSEDTESGLGWFPDNMLVQGHIV